MLNSKVINEKRTREAEDDAILSGVREVQKLEEELESKSHSSAL